MRNLDKVYISKAFMGVGGADLSAGYTVNYSTELIVYQTIKRLPTSLSLYWILPNSTAPHFSAWVH